MMSFDTVPLLCSSDDMGDMGDMGYPDGGMGVYEDDYGD